MPICAVRFKGKRVYPSVPNQPSEAGAHFMFELAKSVLAKAGGNSSTSLFTQVTSVTDGPARRGCLPSCRVTLVVRYVRVVLRSCCAVPVLPYIRAALCRCCVMSAL